MGQNFPLEAFAPGMLGLHAHSSLAFILQQHIKNNRVFSSSWLFYEPASNSVPASPGEAAANLFCSLVRLAVLPARGFLNKVFNIHRLNYVMKKGPLVPPV